MLINYADARFRASGVFTNRAVVVGRRIVTHAARRTVTVIITIVAAIATAATITLFIGGLGHRGGLGNGFVHVDYEVTQDGIAEAECSGQIVEGLLVALDVHENVVRLVDFGDGIGQLTSTPVLEAMHAAFAGGNHAFVALDHGGHLLALIGMDEKNDLVMPHGVLLTDLVSRPSRGVAGCGK